MLQLGIRWPCLDDLADFGILKNQSASTKNSCCMWAGLYAVHSCSKNLPGQTYLNAVCQQQSSADKAWLQARPGCRPGQVWSRQYSFHLNFSLNCAHWHILVCYATWVVFQVSQHVFLCLNQCACGHVSGHLFCNDTHSQQGPAVSAIWCIYYVTINVQFLFHETGAENCLYCIRCLHHSRIDHVYVAVWQVGATAVVQALVPVAQMNVCSSHRNT